MPGLDAKHVISALRPPNRTFIEAGGPPNGIAAGSTLRLSLSSRTALDLPVGEIVDEVLATRICVPHRTRAAIVSVVQEAVLNAVLHGNLAMAHQGLEYSAGVEDCRREVEARLADPMVIAKRCEIRIRWNAAAILVRITDQGAGFVPGAPREEGTLPWGRGIRVITALAARSRWTRGGRTLILRFAR
jgi:anti-sigma regulatory factor (Ser/Thr protein kinase)